MSRIVLNDISYDQPFKTLLRPLTDAERNDLLEDIKLHGVLCPITVAMHPGRGPLIVDGHHRAAIAAELGIEVPVADLGNVTDDYARDRAKALNAKRRHLTLEELSKIRAERVPRVASARMQGRSFRMIAEDENISVGQVQKDLLTAQKAGVYPQYTAEDDDDEEEARTTGRDGKSYPATRRTSETFEPAPDVDGFIPASLAEQAGARALASIRKTVASLSHQLCSMQGLECPQWDEVRKLIKRLGIEVKPGRGEESATCPVLKKLAADLDAVGKVAV